MQTRKVLFNPHASLAPFLLLALSAHVVAISFIKIIRSLPTPRLILNVQLLPVKHEQPKSVITAMQTTPAIIKQTTPKKTTTNAHAKMKLQTKVTPDSIATPSSSEIKTDFFVPKSDGKKTEQNLETEPDKTKKTTEDLLNSAHRIAKEEALAMPKEKEDGVLLTEREFSPKLANAMNKMQKPRAGTYHLSNGMMKIVSIDGSEYCLAPPPVSAMPVNSLNAQTSMPMTCPNE